MRPIEQIAARLGLADSDLERYGSWMAKVRLEVLDRLSEKPSGRLVMVTAMTPTVSGEGKTLTVIGLGQALNRLGKKSAIAIREPSLGPVFGTKGGATGAGRSQVLPPDRINLHFTGDFHAITSAHNLLAAMADAHLHHGNTLRLDVDAINWKRALDMNDRSLRQIVIGLGGKVNGVPRESGFVITAASEIMAIFGLARSLRDLHERLGNIVVGLSLDRRVVRARDLLAHGAMTALLRDAFLPNLVQTSEGTPAFVHGGPFANIAHGTNSVVSTTMALKLADYVVTETGFGSDLGAEKFFDIVVPTAGYQPAATVIVATVKALKWHGGAVQEALERPDPEAVERGFVNLRAHIGIMRTFGVPVIVSINKFASDTDAELERARRLTRDEGCPCVISEMYERGGEGGTDLAAAVIEATSGTPAITRPLYESPLPIEEKIRIVATTVYGATGVVIEREARTQIKRLHELGLDALPICVAKTQYSLSDNPKLLGAPKGWNFAVREVYPAAGAGFLVVIAGEMMLMPGLGKHPGAERIGVDETGQILGLF